MSNILDQLYPEDMSIDMNRWNQETGESKGKSQKNKSFVPSYYLRNAGEKGLISFLNEGMNINLFSGMTRRGFVAHVFPIPGGDPISATGKKPSLHSIYAVIDWLHSYRNAAGDEIRRPQVKLFIQGKTTTAIIEKRRKDKRQGDGTLLGRRWEVERMTQNGATMYDLGADEEEIPDFGRLVSLPTKDGVVDVPLISAPDWPDYDESLPEEDQSLYTRKRARPDFAMDWSDPSKVELWLKLYLANTPLASYKELAIDFATRDKKKQPSSGRVIDLTSQSPVKPSTSEVTTRVSQPDLDEMPF